MSSNQATSEPGKQNKQQTRNNRATVADETMSIESGLTERQRRVLHLQRTIGNRATIRRVIEPSPDSDVPAATPTNSTPASDIPPADYRLNYSQPAPIMIEIGSYGPGDYPITPGDPNVAMAKRVNAPDVIQRDDDSKDDDRQRLGVDPQLGYTFPLKLVNGADKPAPWSLQGTVLWRNLNLKQIGDSPFSVDFLHEPGISLAIDKFGVLGLQEAVTLVNFHWKEPWQRELEVGLSGIVNQTLLPRFSASLGGQLQAEQHIVPWFSLTFSVNGTVTPAQKGQPTQGAVTGGLGALFHFNLL